MLKRPCLLAALAVLLGELAVFPALPGMLRCLPLLLYLLFLFLHFRKNRLSARLFFLLLLFLFGSAVRFRMVSAHLTAYQETLAAFGRQRLLLEGTVADSSFAAGKTELKLRRCLVSSAYGSLESLPETADPKLRERYHRSCGSLRVYLDGSADCFPGQQVQVLGSLLPAEPATNEGEFSFLDYSRSLGLSGSFSGTALSAVTGQGSPYRRSLQRLRRYLQEKLHSLAGEEESGVYQAILLGNRGELSEETQKQYRKNGIAHILAVSGLHLSLIGLGFHRLLCMLGLPLLPANLLSIFVILSYGILCGSAPSVLRAVLMLQLRFLAGVLGRSYDMLSALSLSAIILLLENPLLLTHSGFQLSFLAVLALGLTEMLPMPEGGGLRGLLGAFYLQLFLLPLTLFHFFQIPLYALLLNLLVLPLFSALLASGLVGLLLASLPELLFCIFLRRDFPPTGLVTEGLALGAQLLLSSGHNVLSFYDRLCAFAARLPGAYLTPGRPGLREMLHYYAALLALSGLLSRRRCSVRKAGQKREGNAGGRWESLLLPLFFLLFAAALLRLPRRAPAGLEITALDVGQGDGFVLRSGGRVITIDCGSGSNRHFGENVLTPYLLSQGIDSIDLSVISHSDSDHTSGILALLTEGELPVRRLLLPAAAEGDARYDSLRELSALRGTELRYVRMGDAVSLRTADGSPELCLRCYFPLGTGFVEDANRHSSGLLLEYGHFHMLFTGDMPKEEEAVMLQAMQTCGEFPDLDILKAGHHGSHTSTSEVLLECCRPEYALLSYGRGNSYGHPHRETLRLLDRHSVRILETGRLGEIRIVSDGERYEISAPGPKNLYK